MKNKIDYKKILNILLVITLIILVIVGVIIVKNPNALSEKLQDLGTSPEDIRINKENINKMICYDISLIVALLISIVLLKMLKYQKTMRIIIIILIILSIAFFISTFSVSVVSVVSIYTKSPSNSYGGLDPAYIESYKHYKHYNIYNKEIK